MVALNNALFNAPWDLQGRIQTKTNGELLVDFPVIGGLGARPQANLKKIGIFGIFRGGGCLDTALI